MQRGHFNFFADEPLDDIQIVNHQIQDDIDIQRARGKLPDTMNLEIDRMADVRPQSDQRRVETLRVAYLQNRLAISARGDHSVSLCERRCDWLFHQHMNPNLE